VASKHIVRHGVKVLYILPAAKWVDRWEKQIMFFAATSRIGATM
jgi:hypothetical protein